MELTHFNDQGRARMVDVTDKAKTLRIARAGAAVHMLPETKAQILGGGIKKGDVLAVAQVAGIMAAKKTSDLIPMCHPLLLTGVNIAFSWVRADSIAVYDTMLRRGNALSACRHQTNGSLFRRGYGRGRLPPALRRLS